MFSIKDIVKKQDKNTEKPQNSIKNLAALQSTACSIISSSIGNANDLVGVQQNA